MDSYFFSFSVVDPHQVSEDRLHLSRCTEIGSVTFSSAENEATRLSCPRCVCCEKFIMYFDVFNKIKYIIKDFRNMFRTLHNKKSNFKIRKIGAAALVLGCWSGVVVFFRHSL